MIRLNSQLWQISFFFLALFFGEHDQTAFSSYISCVLAPLFPHFALTNVFCFRSPLIFFLHLRSIGAQIAKSATQPVHQNRSQFITENVTKPGTGFVSRLRSPKNSHTSRICVVAKEFHQSENEMTAKERTNTEKKLPKLMEQRKEPTKIN